MLSVNRCKAAGGCMINTDTLTNYIRQAMPDATVSVTDRTGTMDHLQVRVVSDLFKGRSLLDRHRMIYQALDVPMKDGRIHALEITAETNDEGRELIADG
jgi:stress-induced morphogen